MKKQTTEDICEHWQAWGDIEWFAVDDLIEWCDKYPFCNVRKKLKKELNLLRSGNKMSKGSGYGNGDGSGSG